ncbi:unnamed protein product [Cylindrotheca closterium]|uniref:Uncharacterized protein n=1 Tax=Cylindrotheca closterium TaxID=2856 RepID=A0AAD2JGJ1_9STRA|nr:unnamed protein product [Cylindrotheca closterium]
MCSPSSTMPSSAESASASAQTSPTTKNAMKKSVSFQSVEIAQYPMELGDNPSAEGLPLCIGWECDSKSLFQIDDYETQKPEPRRRDQFWMPAPYRVDMLQRQGVTASAMLRTTKEMKRIQKSRNRSIQNQKWDKVHLFMEESGRKMKKVTSATSLKKVASGTSLKRISSSSSTIMTAHSDPIGSSTSSLSSLSSSLGKLLPKSTSSPRLSTSGKGKSCRSRDPLDDSRKRLAVHLLQHPEDLDIGNEDCSTEELSGLKME